MSKQFTREEALKYIGALEKNANHPLAIGIMNYLNKQAVQPYEAHNLQALSGVGLVATVQNQEVKIVNESPVLLCTYLQFSPLMHCFVPFSSHFLLF